MERSFLRVLPSFGLPAWSIFKELESTLESNSGSNVMTAKEKEKHNSLEF